MAYVRKTDTLVNGITGTVRDMRRRATEPYDTDSMEEGSPEYNALSSVVETVDWKLAPDLRNKMPTDWKAKVDQVYMEMGLGEGKFTQRLDPANPYYLNPKHLGNGRYYCPTIKMEDNDVPDIVKDWVTDREKKIKTKASLVEKYQTIETKLDLFMQQHASLNAALKDMPEIELYVPDQFMAKIREPSQKRDKAPTEERPVYESLGLDASDLTVLAVGHRIAKAAH